MRSSRILAFAFTLNLVLGQAGLSRADSATFDAEAVAQAQETLRLRLSRDYLLTTNRHYVRPAIGLGLGVASIVTGVTLFILSWNVDANAHVSHTCSSETGKCVTHGNIPDSGPQNRAVRDAGIGILALGMALTLVSAPMLTVRVVRHFRLKRIQHKLDWLEKRASFIPRLQPRHAALSLRFTF